MSNKQEYEIVEMAIDDIKPSLDNPRKIFDEEKLTALVESIKEVDLTEPILVRKADNTIIKGERRWRSEKRLGNKSVPVRVYDVDIITAKEMRLQEEDALTAKEKEDAYYDLWVEGKKTGRYKSEEGSKRPDQRDVSTIQMSKKTGISYRELKLYIQAKQERIDSRTDHQYLQKLEDDEREEKYVVSASDIKETKPIKVVSPKAREELLKRRADKEVTSRGVRPYVTAIKDAPEDLKIRIAKGEISLEDAKEAAVLETPEEREWFIKEREMIRASQQDELDRAKKLREQNADDVKHGRPQTFVTVDRSEQIRNERKLEQCQSAYFKVWGTFSTELISSVTNVKVRQECIDYVQKTIDFCSKIIEEVENET